MKNSYLFLLVLAGSALAGVPHKMVAGQPARADSMNLNFDHLTARIDSLVRAKVDSAFVARLTIGKVDASTLSAALAQKADTGGLLYSNQKRYSLFSFSNDAFHQVKADSSGISLGVFAIRNGIEIGGNPLIRGVWSSNADQSGWRNLHLSAENVIASGKIRTFGDLIVGGRIYASTDTITIPDYVFKLDYPLMPLHTLDSYIQQHGHLPDVPNLQQIRSQGGIDLAAMNLVLLRKVEELTLHVIQLDKKSRADSAISCTQHSSSK